MSLPGFVTDQCDDQPYVRGTSVEVPARSHHADKARARDRLQSWSCGMHAVRHRRRGGHPHDRRAVGRPGGPGRGWLAGSRVLRRQRLLVVVRQRLDVLGWQGLDVGPAARRTLDGNPRSVALSRMERRTRRPADRSRSSGWGTDRSRSSDDGGVGPSNRSARAGKLEPPHRWRWDSRWRCHPRSPAPLILVVDEPLGSRCASRATVRVPVRPPCRASSCRGRAGRARCRPSRPRCDRRAARSQSRSRTRRAHDRGRRRSRRQRV